MKWNYLSLASLLTVAIAGNPRDVPFVYGERKARATANIMPGKIAVPS